jgi:hypothetical protein
MKKLTSRFGRLFSTAAFILLPCIFNGVSAQQQQYANAYVYWDFGQGADDVVHVEQHIWIAKPATGSQWVMTWAWLADPAHGGYLGFNVDANGTGQALFSLWNATAAKGGTCQVFGGEGEGWSCRTPYEVNEDGSYKLILLRTSVDADGVWWGAWIYENPGTATEKKTFLGEIKVKKEMNVIRGNSINNFSEYFGAAQRECGTLPLSIAGFAPPVANKIANGGYAHHAALNGSSDPQQNPCKAGNEAQGSLFTVQPHKIGDANGAIIFLGGTRDQHTLPSN